MSTYGTFAHAWGDPAAVHVKVKAQKPHKLTARESMAQQMDAVESGREIVYQLGAIYVKPFITVCRSSTYPSKGKKFIVYQEARGADGTPSGKRGRFWETDDSEDIARWILDREGTLYRS